jgi:hypothetical protein
VILHKEAGGTWKLDNTELHGDSNPANKASRKAIRECADSPGAFCQRLYGLGDLTAMKPRSLSNRSCEPFPHARAMSTTPDLETSRAQGIAQILLAAAAD